MELDAWHQWWKSVGSAEMHRIFMSSWDPIGVAGSPEAADEYDEYVGRVGRMLFDGATKNVVAKYLRSVRIDSMGERRRGYRRPDVRDVETAQECVALFEHAQAENHR